MTALLDTIREATTAAMRARDSERLVVMRQLTAAIKQHEIDSRGSDGATLDDAGVVALVEKQIKQRRESVEQFDQAGRDDLASRERYEIGVLEEFMPAAADEAEIGATIEAAIAEVKPAGMRDMGKVMALVKAQLQGRADMRAISTEIKARLAP